MGEVEVVVDQVHQQHGDHPPRKQAGAVRKPVTVRRSVGGSFHSSFKKKGTERTPSQEATLYFAGLAQIPDLRPSVRPELVEGAKPAHASTSLS